MSKVKPRHLYLAMKSFPINKVDKSGSSSNDRRRRHLTDEEHNINLPFFFEYISSVMKNTSPSIYVRQQIRNTKRNLGYGNRIPSGVDEDEHDDVATSNGSVMNFVVPQATKDKEIFNDIMLYRNKIRRLNYLRLKDNANVRKSPKFIKQGKAYGVEIECYVPLSVIGVTDLANACPTCTSCSPGQRCTRGPNDFTDELTRYFSSKFKSMGIKNIQHTYDGSLDSNQETDKALRLFASTEFRVLCSEEDNFENLRLLCDLLGRIGAQVDASCGLHVHIDQRHVPFAQYLTNVERLNNSLHWLKQLVPKSRTTDDSYCNVKSFNLPTIETHPDEDANYQMDDEDRITSGVENYINAAVFYPNSAEYYGPHDVNRYRNIIDLYREIKMETLRTKYIDIAKRLEKTSGLLLTPSRYTAINTQCYFLTKTVEIRLHSGTISFEKIFNWIVLLKAIIASSNFDSTSLALTTVKTKSDNSITDFLGLTGTIHSNKALYEYFMKRWCKFNEAVTNKVTKDWLVKVEDYERKLEKTLAKNKILPIIADSEDLIEASQFCADALPTLNFRTLEISATPEDQEMQLLSVDDSSNIVAQPRGVPMASLTQALRNGGALGIGNSRRPPRQRRGRRSGDSGRAVTASTPLGYTVSSSTFTNLEQQIALDPASRLRASLPIALTNDIEVSMAEAGQMRLNIGDASTPSEGQGES